MSGTVLKTNDVLAVVKGLYMNSNAQGLGWLHFQGDNDSNTDQQLQPFVEQFEKHGSVHFDYVIGRAVKATIRKHDDGIWCSVSIDYWFDHTQTNIDRFLGEFDWVSV